MKDFTDPRAWHYPRPELAKEQLQMLPPNGPAEAVTLFGQRRIGKTEFLVNDLAPAAADRDMHVVMVDLWARRDDPGVALADALEGAARDVMDPKRPRGFILRKLSEFSGLKVPGGIGVDFNGKTGNIEGPENTLSRIGFWSAKLVSASDKPILLMVDEVQAIAEAKDATNVASAFRAMLQQHGVNRLRPVFTGSSRDALLQLFNDSRAPLFQYGDIEQFPKIDDGIAPFMAKRFKEATGIDLDDKKILAAFEQFERMPRPLDRMMTAMYKARSSDVNEYMLRQLGHESAEIDQRVNNLSPLEKSAMIAVADGLPMFAKATQRMLEGELEHEKLTPQKIQGALDSLRSQHLVVRSGYGQYAVLDFNIEKTLRKESEHSNPALKASREWMKDPEGAGKRWPDFAKSFENASKMVSAATTAMRGQGMAEDDARTTVKALRASLAEKIADGKVIEPPRQTQDPER